MHFFDRMLSSTGGSTRLDCAAVFSSVFAFDYYDGPESGLLLCPDGAGVELISIGDSRSRCFRAFVLRPIDGKWSGRAESLIDDFEQDRFQVLVPSHSSVELEELERDVLQARKMGAYVGIVPVGFTWLWISKVSIEQLSEIRRLSELDSFRAVHKILKKN